MKKELKTLLTFLAFVGAGAAIYSLYKNSNATVDDTGVAKDGENKNSSIGTFSFDGEEEKYFEDYLRQRKERFKKKVAYTPYEEVLITSERKEEGSALENISKREVGILQLSIRNNSNAYRRVRLWGPEGEILSTPDISDIGEQELIGGGGVNSGVHPQEVGINSYNGYVYVVNQLSDSVSIYDADGNPITVVKLGATIPGGISPVALSFNPANGDAWVVGSVSNNIYVIANNIQISQVIPAGRRPLSISYNLINQRFYVVSIVDAMLREFNPATYAQTISLSYGAINSRASVMVEEGSGKILVLNSRALLLKVYSASLVLLGTVAGLAVNSLRMARAKEQEKFFVLSKTELQKLDLLNFIIESQVLLPGEGSGIGYNPFNKYLYVLSRADSKIFIYDDLTQLGDLTLGKPNVGIAISSSGRFYFAGTETGLLYIGGYKKESSYVSISDDYDELKRAFSQIEALVLHLKLSFSTPDKFSNLFIKHNTVTGKTEGDAFSMSQYYAPQNFSNVAEVFGMRGEIINRKVTWEFMISPLQTVTFLIKIL